MFFSTIFLLELCNFAIFDELSVLVLSSSSSESSSSEPPGLGGAEGGAAPDGGGGGSSTQLMRSCVMKMEMWGESQQNAFSQLKPAAAVGAKRYRSEDLSTRKAAATSLSKENPWACTCPNLLWPQVARAENRRTIRPALASSTLLAF